LRVVKSHNHNALGVKNVCNQNEKIRAQYKIKSENDEPYI
jgi:hypothetical protein